MLVLTRKQGEQIRIGDDVVITVVRTKGKGVRLGIQAPGHVPVLRGEIARAMSDAVGQQSTEVANDSAADHADEEWPSGGSAYQVASSGDLLGARGGRGLLRQMVASRGV
jgi:carbon storage regulator